jgi:sialate O-acetylesterase
MVLQREMAAPVWGWSDPGAKVTLEFRGEKAVATADAEGAWRTNITTGAAGGPFTFSVQTDATSTILNNVMVGEVWLASGQSNMAMTLKLTLRLNNLADQLALINNPALRVLQVDRTVGYSPQKRVKNTGWAVANAESLADFSAVGYFFGADLQKELGVPVGIIHSSWGGTPAASWTSTEGLKRIPELAQRLASLDRSTSDSATLAADYEKKLAAWNSEFTNKDAGLKEGAEWSALNLDTTGWHTMNLPGMWEDSILPGFDGIVWFRRDVQLTAQAAKTEDAHLSLASVDDAYTVWMNGVELGSSDTYGTPINVAIPDGVLREGHNSIVVRVVDTGGAGGFLDDPKDMYLIPGGDGTTITLVGKWFAKETVNAKDLSPKPISSVSPHRLAGLYNGMIEPLKPFGIRGAIWYQGESDASRAQLYRRLFPNMITDWREKWNAENPEQGDFPFLFVQLASFTQQTTQPRENHWAELREAQAMTLDLKNTGMATAIDIGEADDIHPKNKMEVGRRLALVARGTVYGEKGLEFSGPVLKKDSMKTEGKKVTLAFDHATDGLQIEGEGEARGFAVAGKDRVFHWADKATLKDNKVTVSSKDVPEPVAVRYGWDGNPVLSVYNVDGLPMLPFRTDDWPGMGTETY